jgi:DNA invertase Pin-like site-specific DNA recombinase
MDLLHSRCFGGFCLVTSDADFMPLAHRIQQDGIPVYNCGEVEKTKTSSKAYTAFISIESLLPRASKTNISAKTQPKLKKAAKALTVKKPKPTKAVLARVVKIITDAGGKTEKVSMVSLGQQLKKGYPEFDLKNYPHASLSKFLAAYPSHFEMADGGFVTLK